MTFIRNKKRIAALLLTAVLFLCPISCPAEEQQTAAPALETAAPAETVLTIPEEETPAPSAEPQSTAAVTAEATLAPTATAAPNAAPATEAPKAETPVPFTSGYAWAPEDTCLYTERSQSEETLLVQLPYGVHLYVKECRGNWAEVLVALRTEEGVQVAEGYVPLYHLELLDEKAQADAAASVFSKAHTDYHGIAVRIVSLVETAEEITPAPETLPTGEAPAATEIPAEATETPAASMEEPLAETTATPFVSIRLHADSPVHIGDSITLEAITEGFDHEPVFFWEFRLPDGEKWYSYEEETGSRLTFIVNRYNSGYIWRVTAE